MERAIREIARRAFRIRLGVGLACAIAGVVIGLFGYDVVYEALFVGQTVRAVGGLVTVVCTLVGFVLPLLAMLVLGWRIWRAIIRRRAPVWFERLAPRYSMTPAQLREEVEFLL